MITGAFCLIGAAWFSTQLKSVRAVMKPIYIEMGILKSPSEPAFEEHAGSN
jgi:hypothetical protein